jgi:hypothetical protein
VLGGIGEGQSLNRFAFVTGQPVSYVDPFGLSFLDTVKDNYYQLENKVTEFADKAKNGAVIVKDNFVSAVRETKDAATLSNLKTGFELGGVVVQGLGEAITKPFHPGYCGPQESWKGKVVPEFNFTAACHDHDYCYGYGGNEYDRQQCDDQFREDMLTICRRGPVYNGTLTEGMCEKTAQIFYNFVRNSGSDYFKYKKTSNK